jgi:hypothetical protein
MFQVAYYPLASGATFYEGAVLKNNGSGAATEQTADATSGFLGVSLMNAGATYSMAAGTGTMEPAYTGRFGFDVGLQQYMTVPDSQVQLAAGISGTVFEATGVLAPWAASMVGGQFALEKDATSGYWVVDLSDTTNKSVNVIGLQAIPLLLSNASGYAVPAVGDTNVRVLFTFMSSVLDPSVSTL